MDTNKIENMHNLEDTSSTYDQTTGKSFRLDYHNMNYYGILIFAKRNFLKNSMNLSAGCFDICISNCSLC